MAAPVPSFKLNTGAEIPSVGLGTWQSKPGEVAKAVEVALKSGYRHIDCAWAYQNEAEVGEGIKAAGVPRSEIFITTKVFVTNFYPGRLESSFDDSLSKLGVDHVDLLLLHWPVAVKPNAANDFMPLRPDGKRDIDDIDVNTAVWPLMEKLLESGKTKAIGVSNWSVPKLEALLKTAKVVPAANQVELHPLLPQQSLVDFCLSKGIQPQAYSPLGSSGPELRDNAEVDAIAKKHGVSSGNILISWGVARRVVVLPKSVTASRIQDNIKLVTLDSEDLDTLNNLSKKSGTKRFVRPDWQVSGGLGFEDGF